MKKYLMSLCAALVLLVAAAPAKAAIINGGFETGDFTGWTAFPSSSFTFTSTNPTITFGHTAFEGNVFAYLQTGAGTNVYTTLSQTFTANAGAVLTFNAFFQTGENLNTFFNDDGYVRIIDNSNNSSTTLYSANTTLVGGGNSTPWTAGSSGVLSAGSYTIEAGVRNLNDNVVQSRLGLDNVVLANGPASAVPEPATMTMLGIGVAGMFGFGLRRRRANTEATPA